MTTILFAVLFFVILWGVWERLGRKQTEGRSRSYREAWYRQREHSNWLAKQMSEQVHTNGVLRAVVTAANAWKTPEQAVEAVLEEDRRKHRAIVENWRRESGRSVARRLDEKEV